MKYYVKSVNNFKILNCYVKEKTHQDEINKFFIPVFTIYIF